MGLDMGWWFLLHARNFQLLIPMKYSINDDEITLGLSIVYIEGIHDIKISKNIG